MGKYLNCDGPVWTTLLKFTDILILSLLFAVTSLPVFTAGAALTALYDNMILLSEDKEDSCLKGFFRSFRQNFKKATPMWIACLIVSGFLAGDVYICMISETKAMAFLMGPFFILAVLFVMFVTYFFPLLSRLDADVRRVAYLAFMLSIKEFLRTLFLIFITAIMISVGVFVTAPFLLLAPGIIAFSHAFIFRDIFKKYGMTENDYAVSTDK